MPLLQDAYVTYWTVAGYHGVNWSKPHNQKLYASTRANPEDSMTFVRLKTNPMQVKNMNAVRATPRNVDCRGEAAAAG